MSDQIDPTNDTSEFASGDQFPTEETATETPVTVEVVQQPQRVFKTGATKIVEDESMRGKSVAEVQALLKHTYPEVANATTRESMNLDGQRVIEFLPQPGRKG